MVGLAVHNTYLIPAFAKVNLHFQNIYANVVVMLLGGMTLRGYIRPTRRLTEAGQRKALITAGLDERMIYVEGHEGESLAECIRSLRDGDVFVIMRLHLVAEPKKTSRDRPRKSLWEGVKAIERKARRCWKPRLDGRRRRRGMI